MSTSETPHTHGLASLLNPVSDQENSLVWLARRREQRNGLLVPGWRRNAWILLVALIMLALSAFSTLVVRTDNFNPRSDDWREVLMMFVWVVLTPGAALWLLGGLFRLVRDSIGWLSYAKDSGGAIMLDSMTCISPMEDRDVVLAGLRINVLPIWPRVLLASAVFCLAFMMPAFDMSRDAALQALMFAPVTLVALFVHGMLGSVCLGLYLFCFGLLQKHQWLVTFPAVAFVGLQIFVFSFGSAFFGAISETEKLDSDLWPLVPIGLLAGMALFIGSLVLAFRASQRHTWLLLAAPLFLPIAVMTSFFLGNISGISPDEEPFIAFFGNMMWVYNAFLPFSPFAAPSTMLRGMPVLAAWNALAFEVWRLPVLLCIQLVVLGFLWRYTLLAVRDRRTPLV
ncbi:hypothetical protein KDL29_05845 [bacterium]|nr:hypothetical protein [bacterium]